MRPTGPPPQALRYQEHLGSKLRRLPGSDIWMFERVKNKISVTSPADRMVSCAGLRDHGSCELPRFQSRYA